MRIDAYAHCVPASVLEAVERDRGDIREVTNWRRIEAMTDVGTRLRLMDLHGVDLQAITLASPPLDSIAGPELAPALVRLANEAMAELVAGHPDRLLGVGSVSMWDVDGAVAELRRCISELGLVGVQLFTHALGEPWDHPRFEGLFAEAERLGAPIWLHPDWASRHADYPGEATSRYGLDLVLGWPHQTSVAVARMAMSGLLTRHPALRLVVHHGGAMIPMFLERIVLHYPPDEELGRTEAPPVRGADLALALRSIYVDAATQGSVPALELALRVFGPDRVLMASDMPFGPRGGDTFLQVAVESVEEANLPEQVVEAIRWRTAASLCNLKC